MDILVLTRQIFDSSSVICVWILFQVDVEQHTLAKYLMELTMLDYDMVHFPPSQIAAGAFCLALKILNNGEWVSSVPQT